MIKITEILSQKIDNNSQKIADFFAKKFQEAPPIFYNSVDVRHSQLKIAPIDTNCFPAGFNHLSESSKEKAKIAVADFFSKNFPEAKRVLIISESHTRNLRYLENVRCLVEILSDQKEVLVGTFLHEKLEIDLENGHFITLHPAVLKDKKIVTSNGFEPDVILLNNDLTDGVPDILKNTSTPIFPSQNIGWHNRTKSGHFDIYNQLAEELAEVLEIDPWLISSLHTSRKDVNFKEQKGLEDLAQDVDELLEKIRKKYREYGIISEPYCYIKADNGTYGIAVWPVFSGKDVLEINKKERNKMNMLKGSVQNTQVMLQEGIETIDKIDGKIAEPMIYLINGQVVGNLFRANESRDEKISLNSAGAVFFDLEELSSDRINLGLKGDEIVKVYSLVSRLAALAAAVENQLIS